MVTSGRWQWSWPLVGALRDPTGAEGGGTQPCGRAGSVLFTWKQHLWLPSDIPKVPALPLLHTGASVKESKGSWTQVCPEPETNTK